MLLRDNSKEAKTIMEPIKKKLCSCCYISSLPDKTLVKEIFCKLPVSDILQCRNVCKLWRNLLSSPHYAQLIRLSRQPSCFLFCQDHATTLHSVEFHGGSYSFTHDAVIFNENKFSRIINSCNGLISFESKLGEHDYVMHIMNPITREYLSLPPCETGWGTTSGWSGIGFCNDKKQFKAFRICYPLNELPYRGAHSIMQCCGCCGGCGGKVPSKNGRTEVCAFGTGSWRTVGAAPDYKLELASGAAFINGSLHWCHLRYPCRISTFNFETEQFNSLSLPPSFDVYNDGNANRQYCIRSDKIGVLKDKLSLFYIKSPHWNGSCEILEVWVMHEYGVMESWIKMFVKESKLIPYWVPNKFYIIGVLGNGDIILYNETMQCLITYNPVKGICKRLNSYSYPIGFCDSIIHDPSFASLKDIVGGDDPKVRNVRSKTQVKNLAPNQLLP